MNKKAENQQPVQIFRSDYVFTRPGINDQYVSDAHSMVWSEGGYPRLRLGILNKCYRKPWESLDISLTIFVYRETEGLEVPIMDDNFSFSVREPDNSVIEKWFDLKVCDCPDRYRLFVYSGSDCLLEESFTLVYIPEPYASAVKFSNFILHRVEKDKPFDYENLGPVYATFDMENLGAVMLGVSYEIQIDKVNFAFRVDYPLAVDVYNEKGYRVWHEIQEVESTLMEDKRYICGFFEIGKDGSLPWNHGSYRVDVRFFDEVVTNATFHVGTKNIEYQFNRTELMPRLSVIGKKHLAADNGMDSMARLNELIGLENVKKKIEEYRSVVMLSKKRTLMGLPAVRPVLHAAFMGNPGTGKTTVAKIIGSMMKELGLLSSGHVVVEERSTLMGQNYASEQEKTLSALERAKGGILFIDEAYLLYKPDDPRDPGINVIETLLTALADPEQQDWMLLIAGYTEPMTRLLEQNAGLKSRIPEQNRFHFDDYTIDELMQIADLFCRQNGYEMSEEARAKVLDRVQREYGLRDNKFGNARFVNNLFKIEIIPAFSLRVNELENATRTDLTLIKGEDVSTCMISEKFDDRFDMDGVRRALAKLDGMVGLEHVKEMIHGMVDTAVWLRDAGKPYFDSKSLKWVFAGNTGTGKSAVAAILGELLKSMNALGRGHLVELKGEELAGLPEYRLDELMTEAVDKAVEGVLFLDGDAQETLGGHEIDASALRMKIESKVADLRGRCAVVIGVHQDNMRLLDRLLLPADSPYHLMFDDYDADQLLKIVAQILQKKSLVLDRPASDHLSVYIQAMKKANTYGLASARTMKFLSNMIYDKYLFRMSQSPDSPHGVVTLEDVDEFVWTESPRKTIGF